MPTNDKDPKDNLVLPSDGEEKAQPSFAPVPLLTPETVSPPVSKTKAPRAAEDDDKAKQKTSIGPWIAIPVVLIAGAVTALMFTHYGAFGKKKSGDNKKGSEETTISTTETQEETKAESDPSSQTQATTAAKTGASKDYVSSVNQLTDDHIRQFDEKSRKGLEKNLEDQEVADQVTIDAFNYLGTVLMAEDGMIGVAAQNKTYAFPIYQVQVTDTTLGTPVKRQFFWSTAFNARQDGSVNYMNNQVYSSSVYYEKWDVAATTNVQRLIDDLSDDGSVEILSQNVDTSKMIPFDGMDPSSFPDEGHIKSLNQLTEGQRRAFKDMIAVWVGPDFVASMPSGIKIDSYEDKGLMLIYSKYNDMSKLVSVVEFKYTDLTGESPEQKTFYWYACYPDVFKDGEILMVTELYDDGFAFEAEKWVDKYTSLDDLRKKFKELEVGWEYEENLVGESSATSGSSETSGTSESTSAPADATSGTSAESTTAEG